jgi:O-methyltransferase involved in polyketide biosynthesis
MPLPKLNNLGNVAEMRFVQSRFEKERLRGPDDEVHKFLSPAELAKGLARGVFFLRKFRERPFYSYLVARTLYFDDLYARAAEHGFAAIWNIGCGADTRAFRFARSLIAGRVKLFECDLRDAIDARVEIAHRHWNTSHITSFAIDLNTFEPGALPSELRGSFRRPMLVVLEGVSPYVETQPFRDFLAFLAGNLTRSSRIAYDGKKRKPEESAQGLFRLSVDEDSVRSFHEDAGLAVERLDRSQDLAAQLPRVTDKAFADDLILQLRPCR